MSLRPSRSGDAELELHRAIARLSVNDIEQLGATRAAEDPDAQLAYRLAIDEARALETFQRDRALALSMHANGDRGVPPPPRTAWATDQPPTRALGAAQIPRTVFTRPPERTSIARASATPARSKNTWGWGNIVTSVVDWFFSHSEQAPTQSASSASPTSSAAARIDSRTRRPTGHDCVSCMDPIRGVEIRTPCGHYYDKACMLQLFEGASKDESLFPPRCCREPIPINSVAQHMTSAALATFMEKTVEFGTKKRVYCAKQSCSRFLGAQHEGTTAFFRLQAPPSFKCTARGCNTITCSSCKQALTIGVVHRCTTDPDDSRVLALGRESGWARCPGCETMIELNLGCYHMTCRCRTQFCYLCRGRWKTCTCPQWDEQRLLTAAEERADAQMRQGVLGAPRVGREPAVPAPVPRVVPAAPPRHPAIARTVQATVVPNPPSATTRPQATASSSTRPLSVTASSSTRPLSVTARPSSTVTHNAESSTSTRPWRAVAASPSSTVTRNAESSNSNWPWRGSSVHHPALASSSSRGGLHEGKTERETLVRQWMDHLRVDHDCNHQNWTYRRGAGKCESCHDRLPLYLFRCNGCSMMACRRCRWNRL